MKWIKANERLPENSASHLLYIRYYRQTVTGNHLCKGSARYFGGEWLLGFANDGINNIEWLDESTSTPEDGADSAEVRRLVVSIIDDHLLDADELSDGQYDKVIAGAVLATQTYSASLAQRVKELEEGLRSYSERLFEEIKHGDQDHMDWLEQKIKSFTDGYLK